MSALWTALHERSHDGLVKDYIELMRKVEMLEAQLRRACGDLQNGERMYIAMRDRCARTEEQLALAPSLIGEEEWNGKYTGMGPRSRETVNEILARRGRG
jgi:hypothetical protein